MASQYVENIEKPLFDYAPYIEYLNGSTAEYFFDEPYTYSNGVKLANADNAYQGNDFGTSIWEGVQAGFGIGAIAGAVIGGAAGYIGYQPTQITGFTKHGINNAISKNGHGVNERALLDTIKNPNKIVPQAFRSKFKFVGKDAVVVLNKTGKVITTWAKHRTGWRFGIGLWLGYELTQ